MNRGHRERAPLAGRRERVGDRPPYPLADIAAQGMGEAEGGIRLVTVDDHGREQPLDGVPKGGIVRERRERGANPRPVLGDVAAVQLQAFLADADRGMRVHQLEGAFRPIGVFAQQAVEVVEDREDQMGGRFDPGCLGGAVLEPRIRLLHGRITGFHAGVQILSRWLADQPSREPIGDVLQGARIACRLRRSPILGILHDIYSH